MQIIANIMASTASALLWIFFIYISYNCHFWVFFLFKRRLGVLLIHLGYCSFFSLSIYSYVPPVDLGVSFFRFILVYDVRKNPVLACFFLCMGLGSRFSLGCLKHLAILAGVFPFILTLLSSFYCSYLSIDAYFGQLVL